MKLRTKLLLGVGLLLFMMVIIMYILPTYFVRKDIYGAADEIHELLVEQHQELIHSQQVWVKDILDSAKQNINALLYMLYEEPLFSSKLVFSEKNSDSQVWHALARMAGYDPGIGFIQAHSVKEQKTAVVMPHTAQMYTVDQFSKKDSVALISLRNQKGDDKNFIGLKLPQELQTEQEFTLYALLDPEQLSQEQEELREEIKKLSPEEIHREILESRTLDLEDLQDEATSYLWAIKVHLIRMLTPLFVEGLSLGDEGKEMIPEGIARISTSQNGYAILTQDVFRTTPLFDDKLYFEQHQPYSAFPSLANGNAIITEAEGDHAYLGNTLLIDSTFVTIAYQLGPLVKQLALSSNKWILLRINKNFWLGFDGDGNKLTHATIQKIVDAGLLTKQGGTVTINGHHFAFSRIHALEDGNLVFYDFYRSGGDKGIIETLLSLENKLSNRISLQLSIISFITMILVLLFIARIGFTVIYPITKLAKATQDVVAGQYEEIKLPEVGHRKDEVATLTRAFSDMVFGLQEREKIRGVLDKVVSKDVADEILRTQIHLGGEDRVVSMLFSDIRHFTAITENLPPQKTIQILNGCMTKISHVIEGEGGVIDKYVGDEVMALFGAPTSHPDHALRAVSTGMLVIETLKKWNQERAAAGEPVIEMGIGVHTGLVVVGNMGAENRLNYTVLGANVNLAARLCQVAEANQLIISESTLAEPNIAESFYTKALEPLVLKGFSSPVKIYEVTGFKWDES